MEVTPAPGVVTRVFMLFQGVPDDALASWSEARNRAEQEPSFWNAIVGVDEDKQKDETLFRVLEWGGMEVVG